MPQPVDLGARGPRDVGTPRTIVPRATRCNLRIREALDPEEMVAGRRGLGGPQPAETLRMRREDGNAWTPAAAGWMRRAAETALEVAFAALAESVTR